MASFFNKKEEVIEVEITPYGKYLLSKGKFKPEYYEFLDDDIIYDAEYGGTIEEQNDSEQRIKDTPRIKIQTIFNDRTKDQLKMYSEIRDGKLPKGTQVPPVIPDRVYFLTAPLGNSKIGSSYLPALKVNLEQGQISGSSQTHFSSSTLTTLKIPQLNLEEVCYRTSVQRGPPLSEEEGASVPRNGMKYGDIRQYTITTGQFEDGTYLQTLGSGLLLSISEENAPFDNENFEIEVFHVKEYPGQREQLTPLVFRKKRTNLKDGFYVEDEKAITNLADDPPNATNVEYYFEVEVDNDIQDSYIERTEKNNLYASKVTEEDTKNKC